MEYREITPPPHLKSVIRFFWTLKVKMASSGAAEFRIIADGCPGIIFQQAEIKFVEKGERLNWLPKLFLYGPTTKFGQLFSSSKTQIMGMSFYPYALKTIFGFDANELKDKMIDVDLIQPHFSGQLGYVNQETDWIELLSSFVAEQMEQNRMTDWFILDSVGQINETRGNISIHNLYRDLKISERQFQRRFKRYVGITPKLFSRIVRFQSALNQIHHNNYQQLSDVAFDNGYTDQSHFNRDFKEFAGLSPSSYGVCPVPFLCQHRGAELTIN